MALPYPKLTEATSGQVPYLTDCALFDDAGVRIAFTGLAGGVSQPPFAELNLSEWVGDAPEAVSTNRQLALSGLGGDDCALLVPKQVHGADIAVVDKGDSYSVGKAAAAIAEGVDGLIVSADSVAAMLGFADCIPVIMVAPNRAFAVVHAGWRGVMQQIAPKALKMLCRAAPCTDEGTFGVVGRAGRDASSGIPSASSPSDINIYIGPHIHKECFETSEDIHARFIGSFGEDVAFGPSHIDLNKALRKSLIGAGADPDRIADADICTMCNSDRFFSYRASGGVCGRHGAIAFREPVAAANAISDSGASAHANDGKLDEAAAVRATGETTGSEQAQEKVQAHGNR